MLVVTANWGFTDGTLAAVPPPAVAAAFRAEVRRAAVRSGFRRDGRYEPIAGVDVVLAGDTCDWLVSREWTGTDRPWHTSRRARAAFARVVAGSLRRGASLAAVLGRWSRVGVDVAEADARGRPVVGRVRRVPVRVTLLEGDRDRGLTSVAGTTFPRGRTVAVGSCWSNGVATVLHGAELDPLALADMGANAPTVGESLAVDLVARFAATLVDEPAVRGPWAGLVGGLARGRIIDAPAAIAGWLAVDGRAAAGPLVRDAWNRSVDEWHRVARMWPWRDGRGCDLAAVIAAWLAIDEHRLTRAAGGDAGEPPAPLLAAEHGLPTPESRLVVLGHACPAAAAGSAWRGGVVCLGQGAAGTPGWRRGASAAVVSATADGPAVEWLPGGVEGSTMDGDGGALESAVWRSDAARRPLVLDAA